MANKPRHCEARQHSDQMICNHCKLVWDTNDPDPPPCSHERKAEQPSARNIAMQRINQILKRNDQ